MPITDTNTITFDARVHVTYGRSVVLVEYLDDEDNVLASVADGTALATTSEPLPAGNHDIRVRVTDDLGTVTTSAAFNVSVSSTSALITFDNASITWDNDTITFG